MSSNQPFSAIMFEASGIEYTMHPINIHQAAGWLDWGSVGSSASARMLPLLWLLLLLWHKL
jgi:hypothetical protein